MVCLVSIKHKAEDTAAPVCVCLLCCEIRLGKVGDGGGERDRVRTIKEIINYKMKFAKNHLPQEYESVLYAGR